MLRGICLATLSEASLIEISLAKKRCFLFDSGGW